MLTLCIAFSNIYIFLTDFFSLTKRVRIFRFTQKVKNKKFNKKKHSLLVLRSPTVSQPVSVRAVCAGRQRAVRQHCVACYVRTGAGAGGGEGL